jgi:diacylglycerol kinase family enzyme
LRLALIFNRSSGTLLGQDAAALAEQVEAIFREAGHEVTTKLADGAEVVSVLGQVAPGVDAVVIGGGDGTIAAAAQALIGKKTALGVLPLGTMNLFAKDLGLPLDLKEAAKTLSTAKIKEIDVGEVNGAVFLCTSMVGVFPVLARRRERERHHKNPFKWVGALIATVAALQRHSPSRLQLDSDKTFERVKTYAVIVTNNVYEGDIFGPSIKRTVLDGGTLVVHVAKQKSTIAMMRLLAELFLGNWLGDPELDSKEVLELNVHTGRKHSLNVMNDGEVLLLETPLHYRILPRALNVLVPA